MKVQCDVCKRGEATILCCADEAALCSNCDADIHAANKLAARHQRVPLYRSSIPTCDICQEKSGYFFCLEDRAILCRQCDVGVHTATPHVSDHHRFLVTGVRVGLEQCTATVVSDNNCRGSSNFVHNNNSSSNIDVITTNMINSNGENDNGKGNGDNPSSSEVVSATSLNPEIRVEGQWQWSDILSSSDFEQCYEGFSDFGFSSVADDH